MEANNRLRDALERIASIPMPPPIELAQQTAIEMRDVAIAALAEPVLNCEVGTAEEWYRRHDKFCEATRNGKRCTDSPRCVLCFAKWSQMPYKKGGDRWQDCSRQY